MPIHLSFRNTQLNAWMLIRHTHYSIVKCEDMLQKTIGVSSQQLAVLFAIFYERAPITQTDVANRLDRDTTSITLIIDRMVKNGFVKRRRDLEDRRSVRLVVTQKGKEVIKMAREPAIQQVMEIMSCLSEKEANTLVALLEKVIHETYKYRQVERQVTEAIPDTYYNLK